LKGEGVEFGMLRRDDKPWEMVEKLEEISEINPTLPHTSHYKTNSKITQFPSKEHENCGKNLVKYFQS
jgi:hypothetical protein